MSRKSVPDKEWKIVLAHSGGVCAFRACGERLTKAGNAEDEPAFIAAAESY